eukprot:TRINITY_DN13573_c0_g1_i1.p1 TRINITY_DN13573_c0_g1~~TRINITY_DN13573_c0_g1_i1.p1  ORF type:complete len:1002 (+),score=192.35 TRINITY_DN13573_c0_g1_i1:59-3064(+)
MVDLAELRRKRQIDRLLAVRKAEKEKAIELRAKGSRAKQSQDLACTQELEKVFEQQQDEKVRALEGRAAAVAAKQGESHTKAAAVRRALEEEATQGQEAWMLRGQIHDTCHAQSVASIRTAARNATNTAAASAAHRQHVRACENSRSASAVRTLHRREEAERAMVEEAKARAAAAPRAGLYQVRPALGNRQARVENYRHTGYHRLLTAHPDPAAPAKMLPKAAPAPPCERNIPVHAARAGKLPPQSAGLPVHFAAAGAPAAAVWKNAVPGDEDGEDGEEAEWAPPPQVSAKEAAEAAAAAAAEARAAEAEELKAFRKREQRRAVEVKQTWEEVEEEKEALLAMRDAEQAERKERVSRLADECRYVEYQQAEARRSLQLRKAMTTEFEHTFTRPDLGWALGDEPAPPQQKVDDTAVVGAATRAGLVKKALASSVVSQHLRELFELAEGAPPPAAAALPVYVPDGAASPALTAHPASSAAHEDTKEITVVRHTHPALEESVPAGPPKVAYVTRADEERRLSTLSPGGSLAAWRGDGTAGAHAGSPDLPQGNEQEEEGAGEEDVAPLPTAPAVSAAVHAAEGPSEPHPTAALHDETRNSVPSLDDSSTAPTPAPALVVQPVAKFCEPRDGAHTADAEGVARAASGPTPDSPPASPPPTQAAPVPPPETPTSVAPEAPFAATAQKMATLHGDIHTLQERLRKLLSMPTAGSGLGLEHGSSPSGAPAAPKPTAVPEAVEATPPPVPPAAECVPEVPGPVETRAVTPRALAARIRELVGGSDIADLQRHVQASPERPGGVPSIVAGLEEQGVPLGKSKARGTNWKQQRGPLVQQRCNVQAEHAGHCSRAQKQGRDAVPKVTFRETSEVDARAAEQLQFGAATPKGILRPRLATAAGEGDAAPHGDDSGDELSLELSRLAAAAADDGDASSLLSSLAAPRDHSDPVDCSLPLSSAFTTASDALLSGDTSAVTSTTPSPSRVDTSLPFDSQFLVRNARLWAQHADVSGV